MTDKNGAVLHTGDIVRVENAYFKTDNSLYFVETFGAENAVNVWLKKVGKTGKVLDGVNQWPLKSYCSDSRKNAAARAHNREHATLEIVDSVNAWHVGEWFQREADERKERADNQTRLWGENSAEVSRTLEAAAQYEEVASAIFARSEKPAEKAPEIGIKFYYNGVKVDGGKLIKCHYSPDKNSVCLYANDYGAVLPREYFTVKNESDSYTDYHDKDHAVLTAEHPLYKFARYVALKGIMNGKTYCNPTEAQRKEWESMVDPGQPTAADLAAVEEMKTAAESARLAEEHAAVLQAREKLLRTKNEGRVFIEQTAAAHPVEDGAPFVVIEWSEHPAFYSWEDGELVLSVAAAEIILKRYDTERHAENVAEDKGGYDKTKFTVHYNDSNGEQSTYTGRYDLGDNYGGLIGYFRAYKRDDFKRLADMLEEYTDGGRVVSVSVPIDFQKAAQRIKEKRQEEARALWADVLDAVQMLTDEQLEDAVMLIDPADKDKEDVAKFFLQEMSRRDEKAALDLFRRWKAKA